MVIQCLTQALGFHYIRVITRAMGKRINSCLLTFLIGMDDKFHARFICHLFAMDIHFLKFPGGIDMKKGERRGRRVKRLPRQMQHY